jgi:prophage tail gpP-like protein
MKTEKMKKQIESMMPTPKQIVEDIDKKLEEKREIIVHNILSKLAKKKGLVKYEYPDGFYVFGNPNSQEFADKKHEEWLNRNRRAQPYVDEPEKYNGY